MRKGDFTLHRHKRKRIRTRHMKCISTSFFYSVHETNSLAMLRFSRIRRNSVFFNLFRMFLAKCDDFGGGEDREDFGEDFWVIQMFVV